MKTRLTIYRPPPLIIGTNVDVWISLSSCSSTQMLTTMPVTRPTSMFTMAVNKNVVIVTTKSGLEICSQEEGMEVRREAGRR